MMRVVTSELEGYALNGLVHLNQVSYGSIRRSKPLVECADLTGASHSFGPTIGVFLCRKLGDLAVAEVIPHEGPADAARAGVVPPVTTPRLPGHSCVTSRGRPSLPPPRLPLDRRAVACRTLFEGQAHVNGNCWREKPKERVKRELTSPAS